ncbi:MAG: hypothetical protein ACRDLN_16770, partial [Solirubrobacteraceae bacterium]
MLLAATVACALLALFATAAPAAAQNDAVPLQLKVTVVPPSGLPGPPPTGVVVVALDGRPLLTLALPRVVVPLLTAITPQLSVALRVLRRRLTISYSGDSNYEASTGLTITLPTSTVLTIVARPRDSAAPAIELLSPADGARFERGAAVVATYACRDPDGRSAVTTCEGPVPSGQALDTTSAGTFSFSVRTRDAVGN